jgi:L-serine dehydratase
MARDTVGLGPVAPELDYAEPPLGSDRRAFMVRSALALSIAALTGCKPKDVSQQPA